MIWTTPLIWNTSLSEAEGLGIVHLIGKEANGCIAETEAYMIDGEWYSSDSGKVIPKEAFQPLLFAKDKLPSVLSQLVEIAEKEAQLG